MAPGKVLTEGEGCKVHYRAKGRLWGTRMALARTMTAGEGCRA